MPLTIPRTLPLVILFLLPCVVRGLGEAPYVDFKAAGDDFPLVAGGRATKLCADDHDWAGVLRAMGDFEEDVARVTGAKPRIEYAPIGRDIVLVGTVGRSRLIDKLVREGRLDVGPIAGKWECHIRQVVEHPFPGVDRALVIAGSDKRGTIYGIYGLSEQIGVSPWYWWADVPVHRHAELYVRPGRHVTGEPAVKYRGIFLNDEAPSLVGWANKRYGGLNHEFYSRVFELILRLGGNYLWPAMWNNCFNVDDPLNPKTADEYGIVMGTSHVEPMMRADKEWSRLGHTTAQWNFETNAPALLRFWTEGVERTKPYENIITVGMRGRGDTAMSPTPDTALLEKIVAAQRGIIAAQLNSDVTKVPQVWCLYKEVQKYYEEGMRVPDDVTLLWSDDNWGNIRRLPTPAERRRSGGAGIYYHFDYVGAPRNYKWLNTNPIPKVWEQMNLAYRYGANRIWIV
ncbi:MAG: glycosyl hydrolase 115 family protein, partial [Opitutaceae bacterium]